MNCRVNYFMYFRIIFQNVAIQETFKFSLSLIAKYGMYQVISKQETRHIHHINKPLLDENNFNKMPIKYCQHIRGYLRKIDIKSFKMTSRKMAIQCTQE